MKIYRIHRRVRAAANFSGAMAVGGRWNPVGTPMLYAAQHLSLACLEILVHLDKADLPADYVWSWTELSETPEVLESADITSVSSCRDAGRLWATTAGQLAIRVQSAVIPHELNILLNPTHAEYHRLLWSEPTPFQFDPRLSDLRSSPNDVY